MKKYFDRIAELGPLRIRVHEEKYDSRGLEKLWDWFERFLVRRARRFVAHDFDPAFRGEDAGQYPGFLFARGYRPNGERAMEKTLARHPEGKTKPLRRTGGDLP